MPEAFTYFDMQRMISSQVPFDEYILELHPRWHRKVSSKIATIENPGLLEAIKGKPFSFQGSDVQFHGKQLGIPLIEGVWLRVQFALHGHALPASREQYDTMIEAWDKEKDKRKHIFIQGAIVGSKMCIILVDRNKLMTITAVQTTIASIWYNTSWAPCPIQEPNAFEKNLRFSSTLRSPKRTSAIYKEMTNSSNNDLWNGIGTSHAVEILHRAYIHPEHHTNDIFQKSELKNRLLAAIRSFFEIANSQEYRQRVPAGTTSDQAFDFSDSVTRYINSQFTKAYRKSEVGLPLADYNMLQQNNLLHPDSEPLKERWEENLYTSTGRLVKKIVPIYTIELRSKKGGKLDPDEDEENIEKKGKAKYTYTCIFPQAGAKNGRILSKEEAEKKQRYLSKDGNKAEIGIASFMDTILQMRLRKEITVSSSHVVAIPSGKRGRPRKRKITEED